MIFVKLKDICDVRDGTHDSPKYIAVGGYPLVTSKNITNGKLDLSDVNFISQDDYEAINKRSKVDTGDIIMPMIGTIGNPIIVGEFCDFAIKNVALIKPKSQDVIIEYVYYLLTSDRFVRFINSKNRGGTQKFISLNDIRNFKVPLADIPEQIQIIRNLNTITRIKDKSRIQLSKLDELIKSRFVEMFGTIHNNVFSYEIKCLQDICEPIKDGTHQTPEYTEDKNSGYIFLSSKDVTSKMIDWTNTKFIPQHLHDELYARIAPRKGDILLAKNGTTGVAAIVDRDVVFDIYVSLALLRPISVNSVYLWAAINSVETKEQFDSSLKGIGVPNLHLGEIKKVKVIVPPIELQNLFADFVTKVEQQKATVQQSIDKLETLKKSLMQEYFG